MTCWDETALQGDTHSLSGY